MHDRQPHWRTAVAGAVLAGGRGARMGGRDKAWVEWRGRALIEHVLDRFAPQVDTLRVCTSRSAERYRAAGLDRVDDDARFDAFSGPLAGILAGLGAAGPGWVAFVPCDAPFLPLDLVDRLAAAAAAAGASAAVARADGHLQPVFCLLARALQPRLVDAVAAGERRPIEFLRSVGAAEVAFADAGAFANVNEPDGGNADGRVATPAHDPRAGADAGAGAAPAPGA